MTVGLDAGAAAAALLWPPPDDGGAGHAPERAALKVRILSLGGLPHRRGAGELWRRDTFAVCMRWPSRPYLGEAELSGLQAEAPCNMRRTLRGPEDEEAELGPEELEEEQGGDDCVSIVSGQMLALPWLPRQRSVVVSVHEQDLAAERLIGEVELLLQDCVQGEQRRYPIYAPDTRDIAGHICLIVWLPTQVAATSSGFPARLPATGSGRRRDQPWPPPSPPLRRKRGATWWSPFCLCSRQETGFAETC
mmetsp:Transcript_39798/g.84948  ORF Transcript_39798/g.84948 Transcript_39798/m.84948 type:complete len:249 (+) Transcript_39798:85-831(+)